ncbi:MAG: ABC transporter ATP-binding protein [Porticoccaceae bacterium]
MAETCIRIERLGKTYRGQATPALQEIDLAVAEGEFVALVGASGCGKSTLLRLLAGLEAPSLGRVCLDGRPVMGPGADRAVVFQDYSLYPWLNVLENVRFCRSLRAHTRDASESEVNAAVERAYALLELMGLDEVRERYPNQLSGGMRQRVAIARALMAQPRVLLMDEPFGALDAQTREVMHELILRLFEIERSTIVFVTHDVEEAVYLADRVVVLAPQPGRIDSIHPVALPPPGARHPDLKLAPEFLSQKKTVLDRIRATSGVQRDLDKLSRLAELSRRGRRPDAKPAIGNH